MSAKQRSVRVGFKGDEIRRQNLTRMKIIYHMRKVKKPMKLCELTHETDIARQQLKWHLPVMISEGICLEGEVGGEIYYMLQPFFYEDQLFKDFELFLNNAIDFISDKNSHDFSLCKVTTGAALKNCFEAFVHFYDFKIDTLPTFNGTS